MSVKASSLKKNSAQLALIKKEVNIILAHLDTELKIARDAGKHNVVITLPITFDIPNMSNADSQRIIYAKIIGSLIDREFIPEIELRQDASILRINWLSADELREMDIQTALIAKYTKKE